MVTKTGFRLSMLMFAVVLAASTATAQSSEISFTTNSDGMVLIPASFGSVKAQVIFDTGAGLDVLAPSLVAKLHGKPAGVFTGFRMNGERLDIGLYTIPEINIGKMVKKDVLVGAWKVFDDLHLDGIVSLNDFRNQPVTFDFKSHKIVLETKQSLHAREAHAVNTPLSFDDLRGISIDSFLRMIIGKQPMQCEVDTGSPSATINSRYMQELGVDPNGKHVKRVEKKNMAGKNVVRYDTTIPSIALAADARIALENAPVSFEDIVYDCVLGVDFWKGRVVTFDLPHRRMLIEQSHN